MAMIGNFKDYKFKLPWEEQPVPTQTAQARAQAVKQAPPQQRPMTNMLGTYGNQTGVAQYLQQGQQYMQQAQPQQQQPSGSNSEPGAMSTFGKLLNVFSKVLDSSGSAMGGGGGAQQMQPFQYNLAPGVHPDITNAAADRQAKAGQIQVQQYAAQQQAQVDQQKVDLYRQNLELDQQRAQREEAMAPLEAAKSIAALAHTGASTAAIEQDVQHKELTFPSELSYLSSRARSGEISADQQEFLDPIMREYELNKLALQQLELLYAPDDAELTAGIKRAQLANAEYTNAFAKATLEGNIDATNTTNRYSASLNNLLLNNVGEEGVARLEQIRRTIAESRLAASEATSLLPGAGEAAVLKRNLETEGQRANIDIAKEGAENDRTKIDSAVLKDVAEFGSIFLSGVKGTISGDPKTLGSRLQDAVKRSGSASFQAMEQGMANEFLALHPDAVPGVIKNNPEGSDVLEYLKTKSKYSEEFNTNISAAYQHIALGEANDNPATRDILIGLPGMYEKLGMERHASAAKAFNEWIGVGKAAVKEEKPSAMQPVGGKLNQALVENDMWFPPLPGMKVTNPSYAFGARRGGGKRDHKGMDVYAEEGTEIKAPRDAIVKGVFPDKGNAGNYIVLDHGDGYTTAYMHLKELPGLKRGDKISAGDVVGLVGKTGNAKNTGAHLHYEVHKGGKPVDPSTFSYGTPEIEEVQVSTAPQLQPIEPPEEAPTLPAIGRAVVQQNARAITGRMDPINPKALTNPNSLAVVRLYRSDGSEAPKAHHVGAFFFRPDPNRNDTANYEGMGRIVDALGKGHMVIDSDGNQGITSAFILVKANPEETDPKKVRFKPTEIFDLKIIQGIIDGTYNLYGKPIEEEDTTAAGIAQVEEDRKNAAATRAHRNVTRGAVSPSPYSSSKFSGSTPRGNVPDYGGWSIYGALTGTNPKEEEEK